MADREDYISELRKDLAQWNARLDDIESRARRAAREGRAGERELELIGALREDLAALSTRLDVVAEARPEEWRERSRESERERDRLRASFAEAVTLWPPD
jgi:small-conductance mechanosensitive channel